MNEFVAEYLDRFSATWSDDTPVDDVRFVVLDTETTGLDPRRDSIITIGALGVRAGQILLSDCFEVMLKVAYNKSSVTVHGVTRDEAREGMDEPEAIEAFTNYLQDGVIVGHHIDHDVTVLSNALERHFGCTLKNRALDTMDLTLNLERDGAFAGGATANGFSLDALCDLFGVSPHDRHTAGGDAFITAQIFLRLLRLGKKFGRNTLGVLSQPYVLDHQ
jgi:DNA polymerase-3 subunit epsilon